MVSHAKKRGRRRPTTYDPVFGQLIHETYLSMGPAIHDARMRSTVLGRRK